MDSEALRKALAFVSYFIKKIMNGFSILPDVHNTGTAFTQTSRTVNQALAANEPAALLQVHLETSDD